MGKYNNDDHVCYRLQEGAVTQNGTIKGTIGNHSPPHYKIQPDNAPSGDTVTVPEDHIVSRLAS